MLLALFSALVFSQNWWHEGVSAIVNDIHICQKSMTRNFVRCSVPDSMNSNLIKSIISLIVRYLDINNTADKITRITEPPEDKWAQQNNWGLSHYPSAFAFCLFLTYVNTQLLFLKRRREFTWDTEHKVFREMKDLITKWPVQFENNQPQERAKAPSWYIKTA